MLSVAALHPCDLSVQVHGSDYLRGFAKVSLSMTARILHTGCCVSRRGMD